MVGSVRLPLAYGASVAGVAILVGRIQADIPEQVDVWGFC